MIGQPRRTGQSLNRERPGRLPRAEREGGKRRQTSAKEGSRLVDGPHPLPRKGYPDPSGGRPRPGSRGTRPIREPGTRDAARSGSRADRDRTQPGCTTARKPPHPPPHPREPRPGAVHQEKPGTTGDHRPTPGISERTRCQGECLRWPSRSRSTHPPPQHAGEPGSPRPAAASPGTKKPDRPLRARPDTHRVSAINLTRHKQRSGMPEGPVCPAPGPQAPTRVRGTRARPCSD